jgi:hypothetical protein
MASEFDAGSAFLGGWQYRRQLPSDMRRERTSRDRRIRMPKNIVVYSDGTGQDGGVRPEQRISNVYKMYRASRTSPDNPIDPKVQVAFYDPGLGTDVGATALSAPRRFIQKMLGSITGRGIVTNIADCYAFIIDHYEPGDRIYLIGFSRGAYTVRSLANLLMLCGVPTGTPSGPLMRFRRQVRDIAMEAVTVVLEHGAGHPRAEYAAEREEQARRFRQKYASDGPVNSNAAPYFIGVFDTVAALGARGALRLGISAALLAAVLATAAAAGAIPSAAVALIFHWSLGWGFWTVWTLLILLSVAGGGLWYTRAQKQAQLKTITDYPNKGDSPRSHYAEWKGDNFDRLRQRNRREPQGLPTRRMGTFDCRPTRERRGSGEACPALVRRQPLRHRRKLYRDRISSVGQRARLDAGAGDVGPRRHQGRPSLRRRHENARHRRNWNAPAHLSALERRPALRARGNARFDRWLGRLPAPVDEAYAKAARWSGLAGREAVDPARRRRP